MKLFDKDILEFNNKEVWDKGNFIPSVVATSGNYNDLSNKPTTMPANGGNASTATKFLELDTRSTNENPQYYMTMGKGIIYEFKNTTTIGLKTVFSEVPTYAEVSTYISWGDPSGGYPFQLAVNTVGMYYRIGTSTTTWGVWSKVAKTSDIPTKVSELTNDSGFITATASISGNSTTSTKLQTPRTVNGVNFDGTANITVVDSTKEPTITIGLVSQFWSGTKTWRDLATDIRSVVLTGLSTATNTVITATDNILVALGKLQAQITSLGSIKANLASPTFTGTPKSTTPATSDNSTNISTTAFVKAQGYITSSQAGTVVTVSPTVPSSPKAGDIWIQTL